jgi:addiction module RelB/DinJ family antitoxin
MSTTTINVRIDSATKNKAKKIIEDIGLDISSAVKAFFDKIIATKGIPFALHSKGLMYDEKFIKMMKEETDWAIQHGKRYSAEQLIAEWKNEDGRV